MFLADGNRSWRVEITEEILPGLYRIIFPLSGSPLGAANSHLITSAEKSLLNVTGMNRQECLRQMHSSLRELDIDLNKADFFITHQRMNHLGLVPALATPSSKVYFKRPDNVGREIKILETKRIAKLY